MPELRYLDQAKDDLIQIHHYLTDESGSKKTARKFCDKLDVQCRTIAGFPGQMGRQRPELKAGLRSVAFGNYVIFFLYNGDYLDIVSIVEGHRDIDALFYKRYTDNKENPANE